MRVGFLQLVPQVAEEEKDPEAAEEMRPLLPERRAGGQRRRRAVRQLQAPKLAEQLPSKQRGLLQPVQ